MDGKRARGGEVCRWPGFAVRSSSLANLHQAFCNVQPAVAFDRLHLTASRTTADPLCIQFHVEINTEVITNHVTKVRPPCVLLQNRLPLISRPSSKCWVDLGGIRKTSGGTRPRDILVSNTYCGGWQ